MPADCGGVDPHPQGTTLANQYGLSDEESLGWFCVDFGVGEID
jgi:hypothetical protein